jgi:hypothetical protein
MTDADKIEEARKALRCLYIAADEAVAGDVKTKVETAFKDLQEKAEALEKLPPRVLAMCKKRGWSLHWTHRGAYLHLESSELIEAIRGKHGDPADEAGDVLLVLMSITEYAGIPFSTVLTKATTKLEHLESSPPYAGEERS